ncbi:MAG: hypothetical protein IPM29_23210 [Planctomycetes bacterium]|nr:hypothetical protein [Planctomycetota bacterium]
MSPHTIGALVACALGFIGLLLPWQGGGDRFAFYHPHGGALGLVLFAVVAHVFGTSAQRPVRWWRPLLTIALGFGGMVTFACYAYGPGPLWPRWSGPWTTFVALVALIAVAADELRRALAPPSTPAGNAG